MDRITDEKVFIQRFRFSIVCQRTSINKVDNELHVSVKKTFSVVQVLGLTGYALPHLQDSDPWLWRMKISSLSGTTQNFFRWFCASSFSLQNVGLDTKKDPRRRSRGLNNSSEPMLGASL